MPAIEFLTIGRHVEKNAKFEDDFFYLSNLSNVNSAIAIFGKMTITI